MCDAFPFREFFILSRHTTFQPIHACLRVSICLVFFHHYNIHHEQPVLTQSRVYTMVDNFYIYIGMLLIVFVYLSCCLLTMLLPFPLGFYLVFISCFGIYVLLKNNRYTELFRLLHSGVIINV